MRDLIRNHQLQQSITKSITRHAREVAPLVTDPGSVPSPAMGLSETLKLLFAVKKLCPEFADFSEAVKPMLDLVTSLHREHAVSSQQLFRHIMDALHILPLGATQDDDLFPCNDEQRLVKVIVTEINDATVTREPEELDLVLSSSTIFLLRMYSRAPQSVREFLQDKLLPHEEERDKPLGQSNSLSARLLRLSTSGHTPQLRELIPELFFELSGRSAETFVNNVGYGYASGYLQNRRIPFNVSAGHASDDANEGSTSMRGDVNPVTGQFFASEPPAGTRPMTEEEKEREAEKLFVLFERLKQTGVVDVKNPVQEAIDTGRFEEVPDDQGEGS
ncbi:MAG: hypothetical protein Q9159_003927 [Coniocarpon cinnabarinum]